jgi:chromosome segregation ATPase
VSNDQAERVGWPWDFVQEFREKLHLIANEQRITNHRLKEIEKKMADLQTALTDLQAAVQTAVAELTGGAVAALQAALAQAQSDLQAARDLDATDQAAIDDLTARLGQSMQSAQDAADQIESRVQELQSATGAPPTA